MLEKNKVKYYDISAHEKENNPSIGFIVDECIYSMAMTVAREVWGEQELNFYILKDVMDDSVYTLIRSIEISNIPEFSRIFIWVGTHIEENDRDKKWCCSSHTTELQFVSNIQLILEKMKEKCQDIFVVSPFAYAKKYELDQMDPLCNIELEKRGLVLREIARLKEAHYIDIYSESQNLFIFKHISVNVLTEQGLKYIGNRIKTELLSSSPDKNKSISRTERLKLSVITVCYNSQNTIEKTIRSVLSQRNVDIEYIIIDGSSTDKTLQIIDRYRDKITKIISEPDKGIFDAMNKGIGVATGDIISFINSDDWYEPNVLCLVEQTFLSSQADIVVGNSYYISQTGGIVLYNGDTHGTNDIRIRMPYHHESIFAKKGLFKEAGNFNLKYKLAADYDWFLRQFLQGADICRIDIPVFSFTYGGVSSTNVVRCAYEAKVIASSYTTDERLLTQINEQWVDIVAANRKNFEVVEFIQNNELADIVKVYVWGTGKRAEETFHLLKYNGVSVMAYIDEDKEKQKLIFHGYNVVGFEQVPTDSLIIIATSKYESEIRNMLIREGWNVRHIYSIKDLNRLVAVRIAMNWEQSHKL